MRRFVHNAAAVLFFWILSIFCTIALVNASEPTPDHIQKFGHVSSEETDALIPEDFIDYYNDNPHFVGWLNAGDSIDYPVVRFDDDFYLHHDFYGQEDENGTLFVEEWTQLKPRDWMVTIFGHNMRSGNMFGTLQKFEDYDYVCSHPLIQFRTIYDAQKVYYVPAAALQVSLLKESPDYFCLSEPWWFYIKEVKAMEGEEIESTDYAPDVNIVLQNYDHTEEDVAELNQGMKKRQEQYLQDTMSRSLWSPPVQVSADDEFLMLVTCSYSMEEGRFLLLCRKIRQDETPDEIAQEFLLSRNG